nr:eukaryotic translation initiation factor 3-like [Babesia sp. WA1]
MVEQDTKSSRLDLCVQLIPLLQDAPKFEMKTPSSLQQKGISFFDSLALYYPKIKSVVFHKVLLKISKVYASMTIDHFVSCICPSEFYEWNDAEKQIIPLVHKGLCQVRLDYANRILYFNATSATSNSIGPIRLHLTDLGKNLYYAMRLLNPHESVQSTEERRLHLFSTRSGIEKERAKLIKRTSEIYQRRQEHQEEQMRAEEERKKLEIQNKLNEERAERERREEVLRQMEMQRRKDEKYKMKSETVQQMLETIRKLGGNQMSRIMIKGKTLEEINVEDVMEGFVDYDDLEKAQEEQRARERMEIIKQRKAEVKRIDHFVRAVREMEMKLYQQWQDRVYEQDTQILLEFQKQRESKHKLECEQAKQEKEAFTLVAPEKNEWVEERMALRREEYQEEVEKQRQRLIEQLKRDKIQRAYDRKVAEMRRLEEERLLQEKLERERELELARQREEEQREKLLQQAEKQRAKELEIERRLLQQNSSRPSEPAADSWRQPSIDTNNRDAHWERDEEDKKKETKTSGGFKLFGRRSDKKTSADDSWR